MVQRPVGGCDRSRVQLIPFQADSDAETHGELRSVWNGNDKVDKFQDDDGIFTDYGDGSESDALGLQAAKFVYRTLGLDADDLVTFNIRSVPPWGSPRRGPGPSPRGRDRFSHREPAEDGTLSAIR
ncbi:MAG: S-layer y protein [Actinomycetota bacterium]|nr:S-layer y protein [Actinomycetota bacterium]